MAVTENPQLDDLQMEFVETARDAICALYPAFQAHGVKLGLPPLEIAGRIIGVLLGCASWRAVQCGVARDGWLRDCADSYDLCVKVDRDESHPATN